MTPTILDMAHVFGLRPSYKCVDITRDKSSSSRPAAEGSNAFQSITSLEYNPTTFKSYETSFIGFIPFAKKMFSLPSPIADPAQEHMYFLLYWLNKRFPWFSDKLFQDSFGEDANSFCKEKFISCIQQRDLAWGAKWYRKYDGDLREAHNRILKQCVIANSFLDLTSQGNLDEVVVGPKEEVADTLVLQETAAKTARQEAGSSHVPKNARDIYVMFSELETEAGPEANTRVPHCARSAVVESSDFEPKVRPQARLNLPTLRATPTKKRTSKKLGPSPQEMLASKEGQQSDKEVIAKILEKLKASKVEETFQIEPSSLLTQPVHLFPFWAEPSEVSGILIPQPRKNAVVKSSPSIFVDAAFDGAGMMPHPLASLLATASLPELVKEFRQIRTKLRSSSLKTLQDVERALTDLYQTQQMTKVQYVSFISFFENLKTLRDQHLKVERQANRVGCYKKNHTRTSTTLHQLVEEGSAMEDRIMVVAAEIQKLE
ncbi:hypothetical protein D8674_017366 [Pyrus ussuriensis x Pyrus communis]|uniref:Aminotransferase-like plant mobile domain-containing protein n=1 Tax=Pyrus ussuriensis x Pyrus communis TaxID=2448454 RepID=A0A5N5HCH0_9ROSA|nr:hypothetical protein D8674_017366 [Pyrus ussuriensis x Pyrus communis]